jgi:gas vesicle protein
MKKNKGLLIALVAGAALTGIVTFLLRSQTGKNKAKKWRNKGRKAFGEAEEFIRSAKKKFEGLKDEILAECKYDKTPNKETVTTP